MDDRDFYAVLGVAPDASADDIKKAYRRLARKYHPDVSKEADAAKKMASVNEAFAVLGDEKQRGEYDQARTAASRRRSGASRTRAGDGSDFGGFAGGGSAGFDEADFSDMLNEMFRRSAAGAPPRGAAASPGAANRSRGRGAAASSARAGPMRGDDHHGDIAIDIADAFTGATRRLTLNVPEWGDDGSIRARQRTLDVTIPRGIRPPQMIRLAGQGSPGLGGGPPGDLYLRVHFAPDARFVWDGERLITVLPVAPWEAALGAVAPVAMPDGSTLKVRVPQGAQSGQALTVRGKGLPSPTTPGDLELEIQVVLPSGYEPRAKAIYEEMAKALPDFDARRVHAADRSRRDQQETAP